jgi:hypothetical protein
MCSITTIKTSPRSLRLTESLRVCGAAGVIVATRPLASASWNWLLLVEQRRPLEKHIELLGVTHWFDKAG